MSAPAAAPASAQGPASTSSRSSANHPAPAPTAGRLLSLDVYRGLIMLILISHGFGLYALKDVAGWQWLAQQVEHVEWVGITFWDLIQPAFTFMVGVSMPLALARRKAQGASTAALAKHVAWRAFALLVLSNVLSNFNNGTQPFKLQFINVLCQIAFGYLLCFGILQLPQVGQYVAGAALLFGHYALFLAFPGPDGPFSQTANIGAQIDQALLGYKYSGHYTTINFLGNGFTILLGCWAGQLVHRHQGLAAVQRLLVMAAGAFAGGYLLTFFIPVIKRLWTASFALTSAGWVILALACLYWAIECKGWRRWGFPFLVIGTNSLFIYSFSQVLRGWLDRGLGVFTGKFAFLGSLGAIPQNLAVLACMWGLCYWLYRRQIFFKF